MEQESKPRHKSIWYRLDKPHNEIKSRNKIRSININNISKPVFELEAHLEMASLIRKRQFEQIDKDLYKRRVPVKQKLKFNNNNEKMQPKKGQLKQNENQLDVQSGNNKEVPQNEILEMKLKMKLKLEAMEKHMNELRLNLKLDSKMNLASEASANQQEELAQSRTVLVTNVHFGAKKEALVAHFSKCGPVAKVVMLKDSVTVKPKGAAYVIFTSKESAEKALSLNGTSFLFRIINVTRKADKPAGIFVPPQRVMRPFHPLQLPPFSRIPLQFKRSNTHLQWRREPAAPTAISINYSK